MQFDVEALDRPQRYKLFTSLVVPRPIALVSTLGPGGVVNAAPFSFFNMFGEDPPILMFSAEDRASGGPKDTVANVMRSKQFVVHLVDETIAEQMHGCAIDTSPEVSEVELVGFSTLASRCVAPPRIAQAPVAFECELHTHLVVGVRTLIIGRVLWVHVRDGIIDAQTMRRQPDAYFPIGRLYANGYCSTRDAFKLDNSAYAQKAQAKSATREY